jgi:hypothetical protein
MARACLNPGGRPPAPLLVRRSQRSRTGRRTLRRWADLRGAWLVPAVRYGSGGLCRTSVMRFAGVKYGVGQRIAPLRGGHNRTSPPECV